MSWGLVDTFRHANPQTADRFSWFDYRSKGFDDNRGLRIDLLLASQPLAECCVETGIDYEIRSMEKPSDHAPSGRPSAANLAVLRSNWVRRINLEKNQQTVSNDLLPAALCYTVTAFLVV